LDIIDNHYSSFHTTDPDGMGGGDELDFAIQEVQKWVEQFPVADVCIGNHDRIIMRKAFDLRYLNDGLNHTTKF